MDKVTAILQEAKNTLLTRGWIQGSYQNEGGCCLIGALDLACASDNDAFRLAVAKIKAQIRPQDSEVVKLGLIDWNDDIGRTKEEVVAVLDKAIAS